jgi:hypothetical protein
MPLKELFLMGNNTPLPYRQVEIFLIFKTGEEQRMSSFSQLLSRS